MAGTWAAGGREGLGSGEPHLGRGPRWPQPSHLLLSASCGREGAPGCLIPRPPCPPRGPDRSHPEAWLGPSLRIQPWRGGGSCISEWPPHPQMFSPQPDFWAEVGGFTSFCAFGDNLACPSPLLRPLEAGGQESGCPGFLNVLFPCPGPAALGSRGRSRGGDRR